MATNIGSLIDSGIEAVPGEVVEVEDAPNFEGGAEVTMDEDGGALVESVTGTEVTVAQVPHDANLAELIEDDELTDISTQLTSMYEEDLSSRSEWEDAYTRGLDLLGIRQEERAEPFQGASGVTHPLISESVTQFQAQAYKELLPAGGPVKTQVIGLSNTETEAQASRVKNYMNYMITEVMEEFDPDLDQLLFYLPLSGSAFKKVYYDPALGRGVSRFVQAQDLVVPYSCTDLATSSRITHVLRMSENSIRKLQVAGVYRDIDLSPDSNEYEDMVREKTSEIEGVSPNNMDDEYTILEIHTDLDIEGFEDKGSDGEDTGIKLPYIVTLDHGSGQVLSITRNYDEGDPLKRKRQYFVHYKFLPGLGFYGFGLIHMIGGLGRAVTGILRQLMDAGTLANLPAGFKARGIRIRNDDEPLNPGEFRDIDAPGGDIRASLIPLPFKEPSATLTQLLGSLIESGRRFVSIADQQVSNMNQETPVGTTVAMLERGMKVMSAIHKRLHYAQRNEFRLLARIFSENSIYPYEPVGAPRQIFQQDFDGRIDVLPVSDPNIFSMAQRVALAQTQLQLAQSSPDMHNMYQAMKRMYQALEVQNIDEILPPPQEPVPTDPSIENARALAGNLLQAFEEQDHDAHIQTHVVFLQMPIVVASPPIQGILIGHIQEHISLKARAIATQELQQVQQQAIEQSAVAQVYSDQGFAIPGQTPEQTQMQRSMPLDQAAAITPEDLERRVAELEAQFTAEFAAAITPQGQAPDPLVQIRQQELAIKAADTQRKAQADQLELQLEQQKLQQRALTDAARIESQEDIAQLRANVNRERINAQRQRG